MFSMDETNSTVGWVAAGPFRAYARYLLATSNLPWRALAVAAGVPARVLESLLFGRAGKPRCRIPAGCGSALLNVTPDFLEAMRREPVQAQAATLAVRMLNAHGWLPGRIATACGLRPDEIEAALTGRLRFTTRWAEVQLLAAAQAVQTRADRAAVQRAAA